MVRAWLKIRCTYSMCCYSLLFCFTLAVSILLGFISVVGVQTGAHRYYTHKSFKASKLLQVVMLTAFTAASQVKTRALKCVRPHLNHGSTIKKSNFFFRTVCGFGCEIIASITSTLTRTLIHTTPVMASFSHTLGGSFRKNIRKS